MDLFAKIRDSLAATIAETRRREEEAKKKASETAQKIKDAANSVKDNVVKKVQDFASADIKRNDTLAKGAADAFVGTKDNTFLKTTGELLQKTPEINFSDKTKETISNNIKKNNLLDLGPISIGKDLKPGLSADLQTSIAQMMANVPGDILRGYGNSSVKLATPEGRKVIAETPKRLANTVATSGVSLKTAGDIFKDPGVQTAMDVTDFLPGGLVLGGVMGGVKALSREGGEKLLKEVAEKGAAAIPEDLTKVLSKAGAFDTAEDFIRKGLGNLDQADIKAIEKAKIGLRDIFDLSKKVATSPVATEGFTTPAKLIDESRYAKMVNPTKDVVNGTPVEKITIPEGIKVPKSIQDIKDDIEFGVNVGLEKFTKYNSWLEKNGLKSASNIDNVVNQGTDIAVPLVKSETTGINDVVKNATENMPLVSPQKMASDVVVPDGMNELKFIDTVRNSPTTNPEVAKSVEGFYGAITNPETLKAAQDFIDVNGMDEAYKRINNATDVSAEKTAIGLDMMRRFQENKQYEQAVDVAQKLAEQAKTQGQAIQALSMWSRLTPEGALAYTQRLIGSANAKRTVNGQITLDPKTAEEISNLAGEANKAVVGSRDQAVKAAKLMDKIAEVIPPSVANRVASFQTMAQLLNPKTAIRNLLGNLGFGAIENIKDLIAYPIDVLTGVATGTRTKSLPSIVTQAKGAKEGFKLGLEDALKGIDTGIGNTAMEIPKKLNFLQGTGEIGKKVNQGLQTLLDIELKAPDRAFFNAAYEESLRQQMKAIGAAEPTEEMVATAMLDGQYRTFQDDTVLSRIFSGIKKGLNAGKEFGFGDLVLKYPKTPANIMSRAIEYSPAGFISSVFELGRPFVTGEAFRQKKFVESTSRALTGTFGLIGTGAMLHRMGIITGGSGEYSDDRELETEANKGGLGTYKLNASALTRFLMGGFKTENAKPRDGDMLVSYDWFQPQSISLAMGADIDANKASVTGVVGNIANGIIAGSNTLAEQPLLTGLQTLFDQKDIPSGVMATLASMPSSFVPTFLNQIRQLTNNASRDTADPDILKQSYNRTIAKIPFLANQLPQRVDTRGVPQEMYQNGTNNFFNVMFNPAFVTKLQQDPIGKEVFSIFESTGDTKQAPKVIPRTVDVNGQSVKLNGAQIAEMQRYVGKVTNEMFSKAAADPKFQELSDDEKANAWSNMTSDIFQAAKIELLGHRPKNPSGKVIGILKANKQRTDLNRDVFKDLPLVKQNP